jgi:hypothetical protein
MEFYAEIKQRKLIAEYESDINKISKLKSGTLYKWAVTSPRNLGFHKKFFALLNLGFDNQEHYSDFDVYREIIIMRSGYFKTVPTEKGTVYLPLSISFGSMTQEKFEELFDAVLLTLGKDLHMKGDDILCELNSFM